MSAATTEQALRNRSRAHAPYTLADGTRVPSVTTILGELSKPALIHWAWDLGMKGINYKTYTDALAKVGTLTHAMILADLRGENPEDLAADDEAAAIIRDKSTVELAENCFISYLSWKGQHDIKPIALEIPLVSETYKYGGRADFLGWVDGRLNVVDFKTGKHIYPEHFIQLAGYVPLLIENGTAPKAIEECRVLNIPRTDSEAFDEKVRTDLGTEWTIFQAALTIYNAKKELGK